MVKIDTFKQKVLTHLDAILATSFVSLKEDMFRIWSSKPIFCVLFLGVI